MTSNPDAERALIGACLIGDWLLDAAVKNMHPSEFYDTRTRRAFEIIQSLYGTGRACDPVVIIDESARDGGIRLTQNDIASFIDACSSATNLPRYMSMVKEAAIRRMIADTGSRLVAMAKDLSVPVAEILDQARTYIDDASLYRSGTEGRLSRYFESDEAEMRRWADGAPTYRLGIDEIDACCHGGILPGQIYYIVGSQGSMKTALLLHSIRDFIRRNKKKVLFFSLDMSGGEIKDRLMAAKAMISSQRARMLFLEDRPTYEKLKAEIREEYEPLLKVYDNTRTPPEMRKAIAAERPSLVAVDFITAVEVDTKRDSPDYVKLSRMEEHLRRWKNEFPDVTWVILNQMSEVSKLLQSKGDVGLGRGRGGGAITNIAHVGIELFMDKGAGSSFGGTTQPWLVAAIFKNRLGVAGKYFRIFYDGPSMTFSGHAEKVNPIKEKKPVFSMADRDEKDEVVSILHGDWEWQKGVD